VNRPAATTIAPTPTYQIRVAGHLDEHWSAWLDGFALTRGDDGTTVITGPVADQAQLHGVLARVRDLGVPLLSLTDCTGPRAGTTAHAIQPTLERVLRTERLTLQAGTAADADATWAYRQLESVGEWLTEVPADLGAYRATFADPARLATTVVVELDSTVIGDFMLRVEDAWAQAEVAGQARQAELGGVLDPAYIGHGYATEAVRELLRYCFQDLGVHRVTANCFLDNDISWRLMERVGMRRELHAVRDSLHRSGRWLDTVAYAILKEEWLGLTRLRPDSGAAP
jgi:RimJ/RimL family protein N-acetyltransferase